MLGRLTCLPFAGLLAALPAWPQSTPGLTPYILVGVLEEPHCDLGPTPSLRVLFARTASGWQSLSDPLPELPVRPERVTWTVAFDGRRLGTFTSPAPTDTGFFLREARERFLGTAPDSARYTIPDRAGLFGGWCDAPARRPVVVISRPNYRDPARWKPEPPPPEVLARLLPEVARRVARSCEQSHETVDTTVRYTAADLLVTQAYRAATGERLVGVGLDPDRPPCDLPEFDEVWGAHWFRVGTDVAFLGVGLTLVDAGDYDGDGASELLFWYSGYNRNGYWLVPGPGGSPVAFTWSYH